MNKSELRRFYRSVRKTVSADEKAVFDKRIFTRLINSALYRNSGRILIYVSVNDEACTSDIISYALNDGKIVAVPHCDGNKMDFLIINSPEDLSDGEFGIPTANPEKCIPVTDFRDTLCIVPGLSFDISGNRLGYGGGFYDRFLVNKDIVTVGITYERCIINSLPNEKHDVGINYLLTEKMLKKL